MKSVVSADCTFDDAQKHEPCDKETKEAKYVQAKSDLASRRSLALLLTYALMLYGAPSHRLEEYILALFKVCGLDGRVNYIVSVYVFSCSTENLLVF